MKDMMVGMHPTERWRTWPFLRTCLLALSLAVAVLAAGQVRDVSGTVHDIQGLPVVGAWVRVTGSGEGTLTDASGAFTLRNVPRDTTVTVSCVGYRQATRSVLGRRTLEVRLKEVRPPRVLDVEVGYGRKEDWLVAGSQAHVEPWLLGTRPVANAAEALQGKVAGVEVSSTDRPGAVGDVRVRGLHTLSAQGGPLYVVDGVPLMSGSGIETVNPRDIESVDILKDASAAAVYGSRGANGVVIVNTRRGEKGRARLDYSGSVAVRTLVDREPAMTASQAIDYMRWAAYNSDPVSYADPRNPTRESDERLFGSISDPTAYANVMGGWANGTWDPSLVTDHDWASEALRTGVATEHTVSASGGGDVAGLYGSLGFLDDIGTQRGQSYGRFTGRARVDLRPLRWLEASVSANLSHENQNYGASPLGTRSADSGADCVYDMAKVMYPWALPRDADGNRIANPGGDGLSYSVLDEWDHNVSSRRTFRVLAAVSARVDLGGIWAPLGGLSYSVSFGPDYRRYRRGDFMDGESACRVLPSGEAGTSLARWDTERDFSWTLDNVVRYDRRMGGHDLGVTLVGSASSWDRKATSMSAEGTVGDDCLWRTREWLLLAGNGREASSGKAGWRQESYMARVDYAFRERYIVTVSLRADGISQLSSGHGWGTFPSVAVAWRVDKEGFLDRIPMTMFISSLKIRAGYGVAGNAPVDMRAETSASALALVPSAPWTPAGAMAGIVPDWERTTQANIGFDFGFCHDRFIGSGDFYMSTTDNLLLGMAVPSMDGWSAVAARGGRISGMGVEFGMTGVAVKTRRFEWDTSVTFVWKNERVRDLDCGSGSLADGALLLGGSADVFYGFQVKGLWTASQADMAEMEKWNANGYRFEEGMAKPIDQNGDYVLDAEDRVVLGTRSPRFQVGWVNGFTWGDFDFGFQLYSRIRFMVHKDVSASVYGNRGRIDYWTPDNTDAGYPRPILSQATCPADTYSYWLGYVNGSFLRVKDIHLGYTVPKRVSRAAGIESMRVSLRVENPFDIAQSVAGYDLDNDATYYNRSFAVGLDLSF